MDQVISSDTLDQVILEWRTGPGHHRIAPWTRSSQGHTLDQIILG